MRHIIAPGGELKGEMRAGSDKSITHRAFLLSALAEGESEILSPLISADTMATLNLVRACGAKVAEEEGRITVCGGELHSPPEGKADCGNAGTLMRVFCGVAAGWNLQCVLTGDESLSTRPMRRVVWPLLEMGANMEISDSGTPPIVVREQKTLSGMHHKIKMASAQVKSALLLAGLRAQGETTVTEPVASRDHTERMLELFGVTVLREGLRAGVCGGAKLRGGVTVRVPADMSSAAFFMAGAAMTPGSDLLLCDVGTNPGRFGAVDILRQMGADVDILNVRDCGGEPAADIRIFGSELRGVEIGADAVPAAIDDLPALLVAAAAAEGETVLSGAGELRHKESDRLAAVAAGLSALGVECELREDGMVVRGRGGEKEGAVFSGGDVDARGDHRIAMAFSIAGLRAGGEITVRNCENVETSYPGFADAAKEAGLRIVCGEGDIIPPREGE